MNNKEKFSLEKPIWSERDFKQMGWHDNKIYAMSFDSSNNELLFDIDYIFKWIKQDDQNFVFIVAPSTLIFKNVYDFNATFFSMEIIIDEVYMNNPAVAKNSSQVGNRNEYDWLIETNMGEIQFKSTGYEQHIRGNPVLLSEQIIGIEKRGGISFKRVNQSG